MTCAVKEAYLSLASKTKYLCGVEVIVCYVLCCVVAIAEKPGFCEDFMLMIFANIYWRHGNSCP
jgi:hypothetical protein